MNDSETTSAAIEDLRREVRRLRAGLVTLALLGAAAVSAAFAFPGSVHDVVTARRFVVLDDMGTTRAVLGMVADPPRAALRNQTPPSRIERPALRLFLDGGREALLGATREHEGPHLLLSASRGEREWRCLLEIDELAIAYEDNETDASLSLGSSGLSGDLQISGDGNEDVERGFELNLDHDEPVRLRLREGETEMEFGPE